MGAIWIAGRVVEPGSATIDAHDHGLTVGDGCFETMKVVRGRPFALTRHLRRLRRSLVALGIEPGPGDDVLQKACDAVVAADTGAGIVRLTVTSGRGPLGSGRGEGPPTVIAATAPDRGWGAMASVVTVPWTRNENGALVGVKSTSYAENVVALRRAHELGASEALLANNAGHLCEGTGTNVFVELGGRLVTPPLTAGCLAGVTRELVLELATDEGLDIEEGDVDYTHLGVTTEALLTSSTRDVMAIASVDGRGLGDSAGPLTAPVVTAYRELVATEVDP